MGCGLKICHEHQQLTFDSNEYRRVVIAALCLNCYPKMVRSKSKMNWGMLILAIFFFIILIIATLMKERKTETDQV